MNENSSKTSENESIVLNNSISMYLDNTNEIKSNLRREIKLSDVFSNNVQIHNYSLSNKSEDIVIYNNYNKYLERTKKTIISTLINDTFEAGFHSKTYFLIMEMLSKDEKIVFDSLKQIVVDNFNDNRVVYGVISVLSDLDYEIITSEAIVPLLMCVAYNDEFVKEAVVKTFENWNSKETLKFLERIKFNQKWLEDYKIGVMCDIKEYGNESILKSS